MSRLSDNSQLMVRHIAVAATLFRACWPLWAPVGCVATDCDDSPIWSSGTVNKLLRFNTTNYLTIAYRRGHSSPSLRAIQTASPHSRTRQSTPQHERPTFSSRWRGGHLGHPCGRVYLERIVDRKERLLQHAVRHTREFCLPPCAALCRG